MPCPWMAPSSMTHFSLPTSTQFVRSLPLNNWTHCSLGCRVRVAGPWPEAGAWAEASAGRAQTIIAAQARDDEGNASRRMELLYERVVTEGLALPRHASRASQQP